MNRSFKQKFIKLNGHRLIPHRLGGSVLRCLGPGSCLRPFHVWVFGVSWVHRLVLNVLGICTLVSVHQEIRNKTVWECFFTCVVVSICALFWTASVFGKVDTRQMEFVWSRQSICCFCMIPWTVSCEVDFLCCLISKVFSLYRIWLEHCLYSFWLKACHRG